MVKLLSLLILAGLQIGSIDLYSNAHPLPQGCACHCETDTAIFRVWQQKDGPADLFAANTIGRWLDRIIANTGAFSKTELLIILGRSAKGIWSVETLETDNEGAIYADLVLTTREGKRQVFRLVKSFGLETLYFPDLPKGASKQEFTRRRLQLLRDIKTRVMRRLSQLAKSGQWDAGLLIPVQLPLLLKPPALVFHEKGKLETETYVWSLSVRAKNRRLVRITRGGGCCDYFRGAKCFGGVADDANGETWWVLVKSAGGDNCGAKWHSIRLTHAAPLTQ